MQTSTRVSVLLAIGWLAFITAVALLVFTNNYRWATQLTLFTLVVGFAAAYALTDTSGGDE